MLGGNDDFAGLGGGWKRRRLGLETETPDQRELTRSFILSLRICTYPESHEEPPEPLSLEGCMIEFAL